MHFNTPKRETHSESSSVNSEDSLPFVNYHKRAWRTPSPNFDPPKQSNKPRAKTNREQSTDSVNTHSSQTIAIKHNQCEKEENKSVFSSFVQNPIPDLSSFPLLRLDHIAFVETRVLEEAAKEVQNLLQEEQKQGIKARIFSYLSFHGFLSPFNS